MTEWPSIERWLAGRLKRRGPRIGLCYGPCGQECEYIVKPETKTVRVGMLPPAKDRLYQYIGDCGGKAIFVR